MLFLIADDDSAVCSTAAMSLAMLFYPQECDELTGPNFVVWTLLNSEMEGSSWAGSGWHSATRRQAAPVAP